MRFKAFLYEHSGGEKRNNKDFDCVFSHSSFSINHQHHHQKGQKKNERRLDRTWSSVFFCKKNINVSDSFISISVFWWCEWCEWGVIKWMREFIFIANCLYLKINYRKIYCSSNFYSTPFFHSVKFWVRVALFCDDEKYSINLLSFCLVSNESQWVWMLPIRRFKRTKLFPISL